MQTAFIIGGVAIGVGVIVFMSAMLAGLQANFVRRALTGQAHIQLLPPKEVVRPLRAGGRWRRGAVEGAILQSPLQRLKSIDQWQAVAAQIRRDAGGASCSPAATGPALAVRGDASRSISVIGIEPELYFRIVPMDEKIVRGSARLTGSDLLIGTELASDLGVGVGDKLRVTAATGAANTLTITGMFDLGNKGANTRTTFMALHTAQSLLGLPGGVIGARRDGARRLRRRDRSRSASPPPPACRPTAGSRPTSSSSPRSTRRRLANRSIRFFVGAVGGLRHRQRAGGVGGAEVARDRHPARDGHLARAGAAACSCCRAACSAWVARWQVGSGARRWSGSAWLAIPMARRCSR